MCGIIGVINYRSNNPLASTSICKLLDEALWADMLRGSDGTGLMALNSSQRLEVIKTSGSYHTLYNHRRYHSIQNFTDSNYFTIGHNRAATRGHKDHDDNAHPFQEGHIALVHNGTLSHFHEDYKDKDWNKNVDSKALTKIIAEHGLIKGTEFFHGAYAIVWIDEKNQTLNIARNDERPLGWVRLKNYLLIASEPHMMAWLAVRNGLRVYELGMFEPQKLYTYHAFTWNTKRDPLFDGETIPISDLFDIVDVPETKPVFTQPQPTNTQSGWGKWGGNNINKKDRLRIVNKLNIGGSTILERGDIVEFVLNTIKSSASFLSFTGSLVKPETKEEVVVTGNLSMAWREVVPYLNDAKNTFMGEVTQLSEAKSGSLNVSVKDVTKCTDTTCVATKPPAAFTVVTAAKEVVKQTSKILQLPLKDLSLDTKGNFKCCGCEGIFPETMKRLWKRATYDDKKKAYINETFELCPSCMAASAVDDDTYLKILKPAKGMLVQ